MVYLLWLFSDPTEIISHEWGNALIYCSFVLIIKFKETVIDSDSQRVSPILLSMEKLGWIHRPRVNEFLSSSSFVCFSWLWCHTRSYFWNSLLLYSWPASRSWLVLNHVLHLRHGSDFASIIIFPMVSYLRLT